MPDYAGGAMENVGLITFRESYLLTDPKTASLDERIGVASIIAHEMSHMVRHSARPPWRNPRSAFSTKVLPFSLT